MTATIPPNPDYFTHPFVLLTPSSTLFHLILSTFVYVALDKRGAQYVIPVQAKGGNDRIGVVQIEQDFAIGAKKFPHLICRPVAAQFMSGGVIALFEFEEEVGGSIGIVSEKHYRLVPPDQISAMELLAYQRRPDS